ncbi:UNVERIFIED_CONTAM: hypothetical protein Sradi_6930800 [Sesamum radiatum]|uniref:DUF4283 domain-containing protein n=1 Tax=Sesamum radiatum TaxID=300843 RepID=A0AAW2JIY1_SESRA
MVNDEDIGDCMDSPNTVPVIENPNPEFFVGNIQIKPANSMFHDSIAEAFHQSSRKELEYIPPTLQKGEIIVRPSPTVVETGSKRWNTTAVGYFLGKKPYFHQLESFAKKTWTSLIRVNATVNGFFFFQFRTVADMEEIIEGGPWLFQGQPIVLQRWEPGMSLRKQKHTQIPVWIRLKHLPMEYWTNEVVSPVISMYGREVEVWLHLYLHNKPVNDPSMISAAAWNVRGLNGIAHQKSVGQLVGEFQVQFLGLLETRVRAPNSQLIQKATLPNWRWFVDYNDPGSRIWLAWCGDEVEVNILAVDKQFIHCDVTNKKEHTKCLITVLYGDNELTGRRELWQGILQLSRNITDEPWLVMGDFNVVIDDSEVSGYAADTRASMAEFLECITESELNHLPFTGAHFTWHNCNDGGRSLWKRLDRMLVNEAWLVKWPQSKYVSANPRTSDHSPLILQGQDRRMENHIFRFENYMTKMQGFQHLIEDHWNHNVQGTEMYKLTRKLRYMKPLLRALKKTHGNLSYNVE